jgi:hypothetical protein
VRWGHASAVPRATTATGKHEHGVLPLQSSIEVRDFLNNDYN